MSEDMDTPIEPEPLLIILSISETYRRLNTTVFFSLGETHNCPISKMWLDDLNIFSGR